MGGPFGDGPATRMVWCVGVIRALFAAGVLLFAAGFVWSPWPWFALLVAGGGLVWAAYDLVDVKDDADGDTSRVAPPRR